MMLLLLPVLQLAAGASAGAGAAGAGAPAPTCGVVDSSGCRSKGDLVNLASPMANMTAAEQITHCSALCCAVPECDAWAVWENYGARWAKNCSRGGPHDCCLLKKKGWSMRGSATGCTSGGRTAGPPAPPPHPPPKPGPPPPSPSPGPPAPPPPHGGGSCTDSLGCSLAGACTAAKCVCDPQYTGATCAVLRLRKAKMSNGIQNTSIATHTWGGHALQDKASGKYVGFFSYMAGHCTLSSWQGNSMIISAVSDAPDGPYDQQMKPVTAPWTHNAMISQHPNGSYFLFHIGTGRPKRAYQPCSTAPDPFFPNGAFPPGHPEPPAATTHVSESLDGPWRAAPNVPGVNNPAVYFFENGTTLIFDRTAMKWAPSIDGPWLRTNQKSTVVVNGSMRPEDPFVYKDRRGFHMLFNANSGHKCANPA
jgi:hypothetical protein